MRRRLFLLLPCAVSLGGIAVADSPPKPDLQLRALPQPSREDPTFRYDLRFELPATGALLAAWIAADIANARIAPVTCNVCSRTPDGQGAVNALDAAARNALRVSNTHAADLSSTIIGFGVVPVAALSLDLLASSGDGGFRRFALDAMLITEAAAVTAGLTDVAKYTVARARPFTMDLAPGSPFNPENNLSFFSGHTSFAFAVATAAGTIATMRHSRYAPLIWAVGMALAATTGYLRIAADQHFLTDVLVGGAIGSAAGFAIPYLHKKSWGKALPSLGGGRYPEGGGYATAGWRF